MIDTEVMRLRRLRNTALSARALAAALESSTALSARALAAALESSTALSARALAAALESDPAQRDSPFSRGAVSCWQIARVITGRLRAHPYLSYQRGPSGVRGICDRVSAGVRSAVARSRDLRLQILSRELRRVARELNDARALTWSADLGDALGRSQTQIRGLIKELDVGARNEAGLHHESAPWVHARTGAVGDDAGSAAGNWPYLAF
jgi:hypothetical protein